MPLDGLEAATVAEQRPHLRCIRAVRVGALDGGAHVIEGDAAGCGCWDHVGHLRLLCVNYGVSVAP